MLTNARSDKDKTYFNNKCEALKRQIDCIVYDLYNLADDDIHIIEDSYRRPAHNKV